MSKKVETALKRKAKMQERMEKMEQDIKELEEKAERELGKFIMKEWEVEDDYDSEMVLEVITELKDQAKELLSNNNDNDMGKSDM